MGAEVMAARTFFRAISAAFALTGGEVLSLGMAASSYFLGVGSPMQVVSGNF